jgi:succinate dehydrogenase flavin-adding protein (antitoxin of CptAB toxin-antitoxin module)
VHLLTFAKEWQEREHIGGKESEHRGDREASYGHADWLEHCIDKLENQQFVYFENLFGSCPDKLPDWLQKMFEEDEIKRDANRIPTNSK